MNARHLQRDKEVACGELVSKSVVAMGWLWGLLVADAEAG